MAANDQALDCAAEIAEAGSPDSLHLRVAAAFIVGAGSALGVFLPLLLQRWRAFSRERTAFFVLKAFGAGVILATGLVHMMPTASDYLTNACLGWPEFPWTGAVMTLTMVALLMVEHGITATVEARLHAKLRRISATGGVGGGGSPRSHSRGDSHPVPLKDVESASSARFVEPVRLPHTDACCLPRAAAAAGAAGDLSLASVHSAGTAPALAHQHASPSTAGDACETAVRHKALAQVLELGIGLHSLLIGVSLGAAYSVDEVKPLLIAITFHQCFEGIALGGCLIDAEYSRRAFAALAAAYSVTTPAGIALGIGIRHLYNPQSASALGVSGVLDAVSAAILVYMALVDLIAVDFMTKRFRSDANLQAGGYAALIVGAGVMTCIAIWA